MFNREGLMYMGGLCSQGGANVHRQGLMNTAG